MATWVWIVIYIVAALVGIAVLGFLGIILWDYLNGPYGPIFAWKSRREAERSVASMSKEELAAGSKERKRNILQMQLGVGGIASMMAITELTRASDVEGLLHAFNHSGSWETRELVIVALGNVCRDAKADVDYDRDEMGAALGAITDLCNGETSGGTYRTNCLDHARMLLKRYDPQLPS